MVYAALPSSRIPSIAAWISSAPIGFAVQNRQRIIESATFRRVPVIAAWATTNLRLSVFYRKSCGLIIL
jgi:hypothetical protein